MCLIVYFNVPETIYVIKHISVKKNQKKDLEV